jgi:hypothetical protein
MFWSIPERGLNRRCLQLEAAAAAALTAEQTNEEEPKKK